MSGKHGDGREEPVDYDVFDGPLIRYAGADAVLRLPNGVSVDLNALRHPVNGELPSSEPLTSLQMPGEEDDVEARARIGRRLRALREERRLSKQDVAAQAGLTVNRLTQVEEGKVALGLSVVTGLVRAMGARIADIAAPDAPEISSVALARTAEGAGVPREVLRRIWRAVGARAFGDALVRGFAWTREALEAGVPRSAVTGPAPAFKATQAGAPPPDSPQLALARLLSDLSAERFDVVYAAVPPDPRALREQVADPRGDVTLDALLRWAWEQGIVVLPFDGGPAFVAAVWFASETPVVVLNESRAQAAYWLFDLAHELGHLAHGHARVAGIVEVGGPTRPDLDDEQELAANDYALALLLPDPGAMLADVRRRTAGNAPANFKFAVRDVAKEARISAGPLGLIAARAMSDVPRDEDRWGSANNLASAEDPNGRARVVAAYRKRISLDGLDELDTALLETTALSGAA